VIGFGSPNKQGTAGAHGAPLGEAEIAAVREIYGWPHAPFVIPAEVKSAWETIGRRGAAERAAWEARVEDLAPGRRAEFRRRLAGEAPRRWPARCGR
jgi:transketolase